MTTPRVTVAKGAYFWSARCPCTPWSYYTCSHADALLAGRRHAAEHAACDAIHGNVVSPHTGSIYRATVIGRVLGLLPTADTPALTPMDLDEAEAHGWRWVPDGPAAEAEALERQDRHYRAHPRKDATS